MLEQLRNVNVVRTDVEDLVALSAFGRQLRAEFDLYSLPVPEWVTDNLDALRIEIKARNRNRLQAELRKKKAMLTTLKTPDEKRADLNSEVEALEKQLQEA